MRLTGRVALSTAGSDFKTNCLLQDAAVLNIIRACETALDPANMTRHAIPQTARGYAQLGNACVSYLRRWAASLIATVNGRGRPVGTS